MADIPDAITHVVNKRSGFKNYREQIEFAIEWDLATARLSIYYGHYDAAVARLDEVQRLRDALVDYRKYCEEKRDEASVD